MTVDGIFVLLDRAAAQAELAVRTINALAAGECRGREGRRRSEDEAQAAIRAGALSVMDRFFTAAASRIAGFAGQPLAFIIAVGLILAAAEAPVTRLGPPVGGGPSPYQPR
jgi:hypothetical protein